MRHLISLVFLIAAVAMYVLGLGPLFFGLPLLGLAFVLIGLGFELGFWLQRHRRA